jgi:hypothetical protein
MVSANRDVLVAIAGVFFLLPGLIGTVVLPVPQLDSAMNQQQLAEAITRFYTAAAPLMLVLSLPMLVGYLTVLAILLDRDRPTVGTAIGIGIRLLPIYLAAQMLTGVVLSIGWLTVVGGLSVIMPASIAAVVSLVLMIYPLVRVVLIGPEMVAQRIRNPLRAILAGLSRTRGKLLGILLYFGPALTLFVVVYGLVMIFVRMALVNVVEGEAQRMISEAIGALVFAVGHTYYAAIVASTYNQLGPVGTSSETVSPSSPS